MGTEQHWVKYQRSHEPRVLYILAMVGFFLVLGGKQCGTGIVFWC